MAADTNWTTELQVMDEKFLECRDASHPYLDAQYAFEERDKVVVRTRVCARCGVRQIARIVRSTGEYLMTPQVTYPDGYLRAGLGRLAKQAVRQESVRRVYRENARFRRANRQAGAEVGVGEATG